MFVFYVSGATRGKVLFGKGCVLLVIIRRMIYVVFDDIKGRLSSGSLGCKRNLFVLSWRVNAVYVVVIFFSFVLASSRMSERFGVVSLGKYNGNLILRNFVVNRFGL